MSCSRTQRSDAGEAQAHGPSVSSQALCHCTPICSGSEIRKMYFVRHLKKLFLEEVRKAVATSPAE